MLPEAMSFEETAASYSSTSADHMSDSWLVDGSMSLLPPIFSDDPCCTIDDISAYQLLLDQDLYQEHQISNTNLINTNTINTPTSSSTILDHPHPPTSDSSKKGRKTDDPVPRSSQSHRWRRNNSRRINENAEGEEEAVTGGKKLAGNKRNSSKSTGNNCNYGNSNNHKEGRWAEKLLNPCALAITAGDSARVQHLLYVLYELMSPTGDANYRLAYYGFQALARYLSSLSSSFNYSISNSASPIIAFASLEPRLFHDCLLTFYERSPWFAFPNNIANSSILQILSQEHENTCNTLHILDIGVSHGVQWPTLLEALTRRSNGAPSLVRLTIVAPTVENDRNNETPFSIGPPGDNFSTHLLAFAKAININLQINRLDNHPLQNLDAQVIGTSPDETLIVCMQFRLCHLNTLPDERSEFLRMIRSLEPKGVILSENDMDFGCINHGDFAAAFAQRVEYLWRFLDSTSIAFKGRESKERRVMEGEAAKALTNNGDMNEGKRKWYGRMKEVGFAGEGLSEDVVDGAKALLRKYNNHWSMSVEEKDGCIGLCWKGQPVSFCSLWKFNMKVNDS